MRDVIHGDALEWLRARGVLHGCAIVTGMPDVSELGVDVPTWRAWFEEAAALVARAVPDDGAAVFFQTDLRRDGFVVDKAAVIGSACEDAGLTLVLSKIVCRVPPGTTTFGRPAFVRFVAYARGPREPTIGIPDVIVDAGPKTWTRAVGVRAVAHAMRFVSAATSSATIVDPFCGVGTFLAVAEAHGFDAIGVERHKRRAAIARTLELRADALSERTSA